MKCFRLQFMLLAGLVLTGGLSGCSDNNDPVVPVDPVNPSAGLVPLTQFEVLLGNQTTSGVADSRTVPVSLLETEEFNNPKTAFSAGDQFIFNYGNSIQASQKAYAYTADGKSWTIHETADANSPVKAIRLNSDSPSLSADYLPMAAVNAGADKDGIVTENGEGGSVTVGCFDALRATAAVTVGNNKATATVPFKHVNHLLNFFIQGTINEKMIDYLKLSVTYTNASGTQQKAVLLTSSRSSYADTQGTAHTVIQAIVPRGGVVTGIQGVKTDDSTVTLSGSVNVNCAGGKSQLITLDVNDNVMNAEIGSLIDDWAFGGEMNPDGSPVGDIFIGTEKELRTFSGAVGIDPSMPGAKINGVLAYTANVVQTADIDLSNLDWRPIGGDAYNEGFDVTYFAGTYNGNGYKISGMRVPSDKASGHSVASYAGLFGKVESPVGGYAVLTNIQLVNVNIMLDKPNDEIFAGAIAGHAFTPMGKNPVVISQCSAQGTISVTNTNGSVIAGGLVGDAIRTSITGSTTDVAVVTNASGNIYAGGMVGRALSTSIASGYAKNAVSGQSTTATAWVGGIAGALLENDLQSRIIACSSDGNVTSAGSKSYAGGLIGANSGILTGCYARGKATSTGTTAQAGAIVGTGALDVNLCYGAGEGGAGSSGANAKANNVVYNVAPASGSILSIVTGKAWKDSHDSEMAETTSGGILTTIPINIGGKLSQEVKARLWVLFDTDVWSTSSPASAVYPLPALGYKGE